MVSSYSFVIYLRGSHEEAIETLQEIQDLRLSAIAVKGDKTGLFSYFQG